MKIHDLHGFVNDLLGQNILKSNINLNKIISNHKFIFIDDENKLDDTFIQQINDQNIATIGLVSNFENKYLIICLEKYIIFCLSTKIPLFLQIIHRNPKMNIISLSNSSTELLTHYINQNKLPFDINITNYERIPFFKEEIITFIHQIIIIFKSKSKNMLFRSILEILTAYLLRKAYLQSQVADRIQNYCEDHDENELFILNKEDYIDLRNLSSGASSFVKLIYHIENKKLYAMKVFYKNEAFEREKSNYSQLKRYPFLCKLYGTAKNDTSNCLILEYINGFSLVEADEYLTLDEKIKIIFEMMIAFNFLHKRFVIRDIHPNNFLFDANKTLIVIDFDRMHVNTDHIYDSIDNTYLAPDNEFTVESDIYSLAKIIQFLFKNELKTEKLTKLNKMCEQCTQKDPKKRPQLSQLIYELYINYFSSISKEVDETNTFKLINNFTDEKYNDYLVFLSESTNQYSLNELAKIYNTDDIFSQDINKVYKYFSLAAEKNNQDAKMNLKIILNEIKNNTANIPGNIYYGSNNFQLKNGSVIDQIDNQNLQNLYKKFNFIFYPSNLDLIDFLEDIRLISYDYSEAYYIGIICFEGNCIIIHSNEEIISNALENLNVSIINISQSTTNLKKNQNDLLATTEVINFCKYFESDIESNEFVSLTIRSVAAFIIRRHFYPSSFFNDASFFEFDKGNQSYEHKNKKRLYEIFKYDDDISFKNGLRQFIHTIYKKKIHDLKTNQNITDLTDFSKSDFIILRCLYSDEKSSYELAIHKDSLYVFMIHLNNENIYQEEEIAFCKNCSHQCLTQFYGFIKENNKIIGFVYQYMCNGSLKNFISNPRNETNNIFSIINIIRIFEIIYYLESKSIKNRIINISNIFLDHNNIPFIFCSNQLVQNDINILEYFRSIIYYLYEKTELKDQEGNIHLDNIPPNIINLFNLCLQNDDLLMKKMAIVIFDELKYSNFFDNYLMAPIKMNKNEVINISYEMINYVVCIAQPYQLSQFILSFFFNIFSLYLQIKGDIAEIYYQRGFVYENDYGVEHDYEESKRCYEISKNPKAILHLGILYEKGYGVKKDYKKAREFYEESAKYEKKYSYYQLGHLYEKGYGVEKDFSKAKKYFLISCLNNHENYFHLGHMYEKGNDFIKDYNKAKEYYEMAAQYEDSNAFTHLGIMYLKGMGVSKNYKMALNYFEKAAKLKNSDALYYLGRIYEKGIGVEQNDEIAIHYYEISSESKNSLALLRLVKLLYDKNPTKAKEYYHEYANIKSSILINIGIYYENGYGVKQDYSKAREMYKLASLLENPDAYLYLGYLYENGNGVTKNYQKAQKYFNRYLEKNPDENYFSELIYSKSKYANQYYKNPNDYITDFFHSKSDDIYALGCFYQNGYCVDKNTNLAVTFYKFSAQYDNSKALVKLGDIYENGFDIPRDILQAEYFYEKASKLDNSNAFYHLGLMYEKKEPLKAIYYYQLSSNYNNSEALLQLGKMHQKGIGVQKDYLKAKMFYELSSQLGNSEAFLILGNMYYKGKGVERNYIQAIHNYKQSSLLINTKASLKLGIIYYNGEVVEKNTPLSINYYLICINTDRKEKYFSLTSYYIACNDMGLICINELHDEKMAENYLQESGTNDYAIGQNSYSVFLLYYLNNKEKAIQILEKCSSENHLALSEFILGLLFDEENKTNESIKYYMKVIEDIDLPIMFLNEKINDEMFQLSQKFIACFTSVKLIQYYLFKKDYQNARKYFRYYVSNRNLLIIYKDFENIFSNLNQILTRLVEEEFEYKKINNFSKVNSKFMHMNEKKDYFHNNKVYKKHNESPQNDIDILFDSIFYNPCNLNYFIREVNIAIKEVNSILFTPPYSILFGRINLHKNTTSTTCRNSNTTQNINKFFLDGLKF